MQTLAQFVWLINSVVGCEGAADGGFLKRRLFSIRVSLVV
jgi:hypothetical protein